MSVHSEVILHTYTHTKEKEKKKKEKEKHNISIYIKTTCPQDYEQLI